VQTMKVALLTFHNALNYGAAMQVYASQQAMKDIGVECKIIDYVNEYREDIYDLNSHAKKELKKKNLPMTLKYYMGSLFMRVRRQKFLKFYNEHLQCTSIRFTSSKEAEILNSEFDKFIVGSDQVLDHFRL